MDYATAQVQIAAGKKSSIAAIMKEYAACKEQGGMTLRQIAVRIWNGAFTKT